MKYSRYLVKKLFLAILLIISGGSFHYPVLSAADQFDIYWQKCRASNDLDACFKAHELRPENHAVQQYADNLFLRVFNAHWKTCQASQTMSALNACKTAQQLQPQDQAVAKRLSQLNQLLKTLPSTAQQKRDDAAKKAAIAAQQKRDDAAEKAAIAAQQKRDDAAKKAAIAAQQKRDDAAKKAAIAAQQKRDDEAAEKAAIAAQQKRDDDYRLAKTQDLINELTDKKSKILILSRQVKEEKNQLLSSSQETLQKYWNAH